MVHSPASISARPRVLLLFAVTAALTLSACSSTSGQSPSPSPSPVDTRPINVVTVHSEALGDNLLETRAEREVNVYLPPQYFTGDESFPVVYFLSGYSTGRGITNVAIPRDFDIAFETVAPMIVVEIDGVNKLRGSFYVDSPTTGGWATFIAEDVVAYIDSHFRTIASKEARGIAGHSMGGFGAWDIAMRNTDVFGSVYMLAPGLFDENGLAESQMFDSESHIRAVLSLLGSVDPSDPEAGIDHFAGSSMATFDIGYGMAFAPTDEFPYFLYPYSLDGDALVRDEAVWALWQSGYGGIEAEVAEFGGDLASLDGIGIDCGSNDEYRWIPLGCAYLDSELTEAGIDHVYLTHSGDHSRRNRERVLEFMLPFFAEVFAEAAA